MPRSNCNLEEEQENQDEDDEDDEKYHSASSAAAEFDEGEDIRIRNRMWRET